jgi:hypothetical protein
MPGGNSMNFAKGCDVNALGKGIKVHILGFRKKREEITPKLSITSV